MGYEIRVVSNDEFNRLPYKGAYDSLGLADPKTKVAYVRETGIRDLDMNTISHEFDELLMKVSPHEEDGIRYKGGGNIIGSLVSMIASAINPVLGAAVGGGFAAHKTTGGSLGGGDERQYKGQFWRIPVGMVSGYLGGGGFGSAGKAWEAGGNATKLASAGLNAAAEVPSAIKQKSFMPVAMGGLSGYGQAAGTSALKNFGTSMFSKAGSTAPTITGAGDTALSSSDLAAQGSGMGGATLPMSSSDIGATLPMTGPMLSNAAPAGASLLNKFGSYAKDTLKDYGKNSITNSAINAISPQQDQTTLYPGSRTPTTGGSIAGQAGAVERFNPNLLKGNSYNPVSQEEYDYGINSLTSSKGRRLADIFQTPAFRGQTPEENSSLSKQVSNLNTGFQNELSTYNKEVGDENSRREYQHVMKANGLSPAQMNFFIDLAKKDDATISQTFNLNTPEEIKAIFGHLPSLA